MTERPPKAERLASRETARQAAAKDSRGAPASGRGKRGPAGTDVVAARGVAYLIDLVVTGVVGTGLGLLAGGGTAAVVVTAVLGFAYFGGLAGVTGKTVGKAALGIKLVDGRGKPPGIVAAGARYLLLIVDAFPYFFPLVGLLTARRSETHQRIGDRVARTYVVRDEGPAWLPEAAREMGVVGVAVLVLGLAGGGTLIAAELSTLYEIEVITASCEDLSTPDLRDECVTTGSEQHSNALVLLGLLALLMAFAAGLSRSRPPALALVAIGAVVLGIAVLADLPDVDETGQIGITFEEAEAVSGPGLLLEFIGAGLCVAAGVMGFALPRRRRYT